MKAFNDNGQWLGAAQRKLLAYGFTELTRLSFRIELLIGQVESVPRHAKLYRNLSALSQALYDEMEFRAKAVNR